jgi:CysZ protein
MKGNIAHGAGYLARGATLLEHPSLRLFVLVPLVVNILIFGSLIWYGLSYLSALMDSWLGNIPDWLDFIRWIIWPLVGLTVSLVTGYLSSPPPSTPCWRKRPRNL